MAEIKCKVKGKKLHSQATEINEALNPKTARQISILSC
jgi:hypothetical protein